VNSDGYLSPMVPGYFDGSNPEAPGVWDPLARIRGDVRSERGVYRGNIR
jgi:hypothetical protein